MVTLGQRVAGAVFGIGLSLLVAGKSDAICFDGSCIARMYRREPIKTDATLLAESTFSYKGKVYLTNPQNAEIYTIKKGDTLSGIGRRYNLPVEVLLKANWQIDDPDIIKAGKGLLIPSRVKGSSGGWSYY